MEFGAAFEVVTSYNEVHNDDGRKYACTLINMRAKAAMQGRTEDEVWKKWPEDRVAALEGIDIGGKARRVMT
jgi:hypothetical protein